jgi:hypothetical protein
VRTHRWPRCARIAGGTLALAALVGPARAQDELDDILGGFEDEDPAFEIEQPPPSEEPERWWDLNGSAELSGTVNYLHHRSATGTDYFGLQRLRMRLNLQLELDLAEDWQGRFEAWGLYDAAYAMNGRYQYTSRVLAEYELDSEVGEAWVHGKLHDALDVKLGRQIVIWGRSETLRVLDVLNPLDNREPGRVDIEDLRRPLGMARIDAYQRFWEGSWRLSLIAIPEIRFDRLPVAGSDFFPAPVGLPEDIPRDFRDAEAAAALTAIFHGWDISLHGAWFWNDVARFAGNPLQPASWRQVHDRLWMVGAGGNYTTGSWLLKGELAGLDGFGFVGTDDKARIDLLVGFEYYGFENTTISVEGTNRHVLEYEPGLASAPYYVGEDSQEIALRYTQTFLNEKLSVTGLAVLFGWDAGNGSIVRLSADYDLRDALSIGGGVVLYQTGDIPPFDTWGRNDRLIFNMKWSF